MATIFASADIWKAWEKSGKNEFVKTCRKLVENNGPWSLGIHTLKTAVYELCWQMIKGSLKQEQAVMALGDVVDLKKDIPSLLADIFSLIDMETSCSEDKSQRDRFISLAAACVIYIPDTVLKERLDHDILENINLIPSKQQFTQKYVKVKTKLYYKQQKFNLLREESEGYAKLMTEMNQEITDKINPASALQNIKSLIGCFDLDPNRVLDVMLESFECRPSLHAYFVPLIKSYMAEQGTLCHILGFKFHFYQASPDEVTPDSLYKVTALLLKHGLVKLDDLYPHLSPPDAEITEQHKKELTEAKQYARSKSIVTLADKADDKDKDTEAKPDLFTNNQKLGLMKALIDAEDWPNAKNIMDRMPPFFAATYKPVSAALCSLIHAIIEPLYRKNTGLPSTVCKGPKKSRSSRKASTVETVTTFQGLYRQVFPMLSYLGANLYNDVILIAKFIRLGKTFMVKRHEGGISPEDDIAYYGFLSMLDEAILPSLSLLPCNCCVSEELWGLVKLYPYDLRYRLYGRWKNESPNFHPALIRAKADCLDRAKYIMKRLSKENVKPSGRQLGKLSHSSPGIVFEYVLSQIQRYDNFIGPVVDSMKFLTSLSYDMLTFCIMEAVANPEKERLKFDDTNISLWLQSLAWFAGSVCKKYQIEMTGFMQYVANQLKAGKSIDLLLLREVLQKMAGIEISEEVTDDQLDAMSGGELLKQEGGYFTQVRNTKKSSARLKDALMENDLALSLCMLMAQQRDGVIYREGEQRHLKLVGKLYDQCQDTLVQFGSFLAMQLSTDEFVKRLPSIDVLVADFNVSPDAAFFLSRSLFTHAISSKFDELKKIDKSNKQTSGQQKLQRYLEAVESVISPVVELVRPLYLPKVWDDLSPQFYVTFWSLSMYDLCTPTAAYDKQLQQLKSQMNAIEDNRELPASKKKKEKERCTNLYDKLHEEEKRQNDHIARVIARLKHEKDNWFLSRSTKNETITQFLQLCIFPRCCFTASDAVYCAKYIQILHDLKTTNFSTLICYDRIFCDITYSVTSCTENEAHRYGRFLCAAMDTIMRWHSDQSIYDKDCASYPGFVTVFRKGAADSNNKADQLDYENYRHVCHKWHFRITKAMVTCLESGNFIQIRNALIILTKILPHYPRILQFGQAVERRVDRLKQLEKEKRPDIYALAMGYSGQLKLKKSTWVSENDFHQKEKDQKNLNKCSSGIGIKPESSGLKESSTHKSETNGPMAKDKGAVTKDKGSVTKDKGSLTKDKGPGTKDKDGHESKEREKKERSEKKEVKSEGRSAFKPGSSSDIKKSEAEASVKHAKHSDRPDKVKISKSKADVLEDRPRHKGGAASSEGREGEGCGSTEDKPAKPHKVKEEKKIKLEKVRKEEKVHRVKEDTAQTKVQEEDMSWSVTTPTTASNGSHGSSHRRSADPSPHQSEDREPKRRKIEAPVSSSKENAPCETKEKHKRSPSSEREKERKERKRGDHSRDVQDPSLKKRRSEDRMSSPSSLNKVNGLSDWDPVHVSSKSQSKEEGGRSSKERSSSKSRSDAKRLSREQDSTKISSSRDSDDYITSPKASSHSSSKEAEMTTTQLSRDPEGHRNSPRDRSVSKDTTSPKVKREKESVDRTPKLKEDKRKFKKEKTDKGEKGEKVRSLKKIRK